MRAIVTELKRFGVFLVTSLVLSGAGATPSLADLDFRPAVIDFGILNSQTSPGKRTVAITVEKNNNLYELDPKRVRWENPSPSNPFSYKLLTGTRASRNAPIIIEFEATKGVRGLRDETLILPIKPVEISDENWRVGEVREFPVTVSAVWLCEKDEDNCHFKGPVCQIRTEREFWVVKSPGFEQRVQKGIEDHNSIHFKSFNEYDRPFESIWSSFDVSGPFQNCCACGDRPTCPPPIKYSRWSSRSVMASVRWNGTATNHKINDPQYPSITITISSPSTIDNATAQVGASFVEYLFSSPSQAPTLRVEDSVSGQVIEGAISCYNITKNYATVRFVDPNVKPILIREGN